MTIMLGRAPSSLERPHSVVYRPPPVVGWELSRRQLSTTGKRGIMARKIALAALAMTLALALVGLVDSAPAFANGKGSHETATGGHHHGPGDNPGHHHGGNTDVVGSQGGTTTTKGSGGSDTSTDVNQMTGSTGSHGHKAGKKNGPVALTGSVTCSFRGKFTFDPKLVTGGTSSSTVKVSGLLDKCKMTSATITSSSKKNRPRFNNGHLSGLTGTWTPNDCASLTSGVAPALSGGSVLWTPTSKVARSMGISLPAGTASTVTNGAKTEVQVSYAGGSLGGGSFTGSAVSLTVNTMQDETQISGRCANGLSNVAVVGTLTL